MTVGLAAAAERVRRPSAWILGACLLVAACGGSGSDESNATDTSVSETTVAAASASPTSSSPPATAPLVSTVPSTTVEDRPSTTIDEETLIAQVEQAYFDAFDAYHDAIFDPADEELRAALADTHVDDALDNVVRILDDLVELGAVARENPDFGPAQTEITGPVRFENAARTEATLVACQLNSEWFVEPGSGPNGEDSVMRTDVIRVDLIVFLAKSGESWKVEGGGDAVELIGVDECDSGS